MQAQSDIRGGGCLAANRPIAPGNLGMVEETENHSESHFANHHEVKVTVANSADSKLFLFKDAVADEEADNLNNNSSAIESDFNDNADFEDLDLGDSGEDLDPVPLGEILEKLQADNSSGDFHGEAENFNEESLIRLHATVCGGVAGDMNDLGSEIDHGSVSLGDDQQQTISATVNVATLDLSDPESIHQHLSQLNDTVLRVKGFSDEDPVPPIPTVLNINVSSGSANDLASSMMSPSSQSSPSSSSFLTPSINLPSPKDTKSPIGPPTPTPTPPSVTPQNMSPMLSRRGSGCKGGSGTQTCSVCSKTFSNASALAKHRLTHSEERKYHCNICSKAFKRQDHLNGHLLTHRSTKPFACTADGCGKSYCDARSLRRHRENHHSSKSNKSNVKVKSIPVKDVTFGEGNDGVACNGEYADPNVMSTMKGSGDTKIKFSSKGLNAQQLQLIEKLLKETNKSTEVTPATAGPAGTSAGPTEVAAKALAAVQSPPIGPKVAAKGSVNSQVGVTEANKQVECTICSRKFKNVPALNGHMRLHGGYYKKDAEAKRQLISTNAGQSGQKILTVTPISAEQATVAGLKRKLSSESPDRSLAKMSSVALANGLTVFQTKSISDRNSLSISQAPFITSGSLTIKPTSSVSVASSPKTASMFARLPPPDTNKLLANLANQNPIFTGSNGFKANLSGLEISHTQLITSATTTFTTSSSPTVRQSPVGMRLPTTPLPGPLDSGFTKLEDSDLKRIQNLSSQVTCYRSLNISKSSPAFPPGPPGPELRSQVSLSQSEPSEQPVLYKAMPNVLKVDEKSDKSPKIGEEYQAQIPDLFLKDEVGIDEDEDEDSLWDPHTAMDLTEETLNQYLNVSQGCAVEVGVCRGEESALQILQKHGGDVREAVKALLTEQPTQSPRSWNDMEVDLFYEAMLKHAKDFSKISSEIGTKTTKDCVEFYYFWKNFCREEAQSFKTIYYPTTEGGSLTPPPGPHPQITCPNYGGSIIMTSADELTSAGSSSVSSGTPLLPFSLSITSLSTKKVN